MSNCAYINTLFTLTAAILSGFLYQTPTNKINVEHYIDAVINVIKFLFRVELS
jgi:hypothetical protein